MNRSSFSPPLFPFFLFPFSFFFLFATLSLSLSFLYTLSFPSCCSSEERKFFFFEISKKNQNITTKLALSLNPCIHQPGKREFKKKKKKKKFRKKEVSTPDAQPSTPQP